MNGEGAANSGRRVDERVYEQFSTGLTGLGECDKCSAPFRVSNRFGKLCQQHYVEHLEAELVRAAQEEVRRADFDVNERQLLGDVEPFALAAVSRVVRLSHSRHKTPLPVLSATEGGGVVAEWFIPPWRVVGEIEPGTFMLSMCVVHVDGRRPVVRTIDISRLDAADEVAALVADVEQFETEQVQLQTEQARRAATDDGATREIRVGNGVFRPSSSRGWVFVNAAGQVAVASCEEHELCSVVDRLRAAGDELAHNYFAQLLTDRWSAFNVAFYNEWVKARDGQQRADG